MDAVNLTMVPKVQPAREPSRPARHHQPTPDQSANPNQPSAPTQPPAALEQAALDLAARLELKVELARDEDTGRNIVRIFNQEGDRLLRQIPAETILRMLDRIKAGGDEGILGLLV